MHWLDLLADLATRPASAVIAKTGIVVELLVAATLTGRLFLFGAQIPDGIVALVLATGFGLCGWFGTLVFRLDRSTTALEVRLSNLAEDGIASSSDLRALAGRVNVVETDVAVLRAELGLGEHRSPE